MSISKARVERLRQNAKKLKKSSNLSQAEALDQIARANSFPNWKAVVNCYNKSQRSISPNSKSLEFAKDILDVDSKTAQEDLDRSMNNEQQLLVSNNRYLLAQRAIDYAIFEPTETGFNKSILDAISDVRILFKNQNFHNYDQQKQGTDSKIIKKAILLSKSQSIETKISLYRPVTKKGDPRMWITKLADIANAGDQVAIVIHNNTAYLLNLSVNELNTSLEENDSLDSVVRSWEQKNSISKELLYKLREIAKNPLKATTKGDTAVGMSIEAALGIKANCSKNPDYEGIEIKSGRGSKNRTTLFAQVANWEESNCKSSKEILERYGYEREDAFRLYCTINSKKANSQGLMFKADNNNDYIQEVHLDNKKIAKVALWSGNNLRSRLEEKHAETFWIKTKSILINDEEYFQLESVIHTRKPVASQLLPLIRSGVITMDHLIKKDKSSGRVTEKGPLFKIDKANLNLLFPDPIKYSLKSE